MRLDRDVEKLIDRYGYDLTLRRTAVGGAYNTTTGAVTGGTTTTASVRGVFVNYMERDIDGTSILADDRKLLLQARGLTVAPETGDTLDNDVQIISVRTIKAGATVVAYVCQTRG
jgi:hypothetical protein